MSNVEVRTEITAPASAVYRQLMDFESYSSWNPMVIEIKGMPDVGSKIEVRIKLEGRDPTTLKPTVVKNDVDKEFRWVGALFFEWLFRGEHYFIIEENEGGRCAFVHGENFSGICEPLITIMLGQSTAIGFEAFNAALKRRVEETVQS